MGSHLKKKVHVLPEAKGLSVLITASAINIRGIEMAIKKLSPSLGFVSIEVSNLKNSKIFYEALAKALDLEKVEDNEEYAAWGNEEFHIWISEEDTPRVKREKPSGREEWGVSDCVGIWLPNKESVNAVESRMRKGGIEPLYPLEELVEWGEYYTVSYSDPDNFIIEIFHKPG
jgi:predicted lactoylglutathione lyase